MTSESMRMLSPPLSPFTDLASFSGAYKARPLAKSSLGPASSPPSTRTGSEEPEFQPRLQLATPCASESPASHVAKSDEKPGAVASECANSEISAPSAPSEGIAKRKLVSCWSCLSANPAKYFRKERAYLQMYPVNRPTWSDAAYGDGGERSRRKPRMSRARRALTEPCDQSFGTEVLTRSRAASVQPSYEDKQLSDDEPRRQASTSSSGGAAPARKRPSTSSPLRVHDMGIEHIVDYSPDVNMLPAGRSLRAEWKGAPMDLSDDPDVHLLHPAEVHLASVLRLPAEVYLDSKRRLFAEKVMRLRQNLPFRRTDSQKACRIDVNKASRLFGAFEKVGWLEDELFLKHL